MPKDPVNEIRGSLLMLAHAFQQIAGTLDGTGGGAKASHRPAKRNLSTKARAALQLQGRYMGYMRQLKPKPKAQLRAIRGRKGYEAAIRRAKGFVPSGRRSPAR